MSISDIDAKTELASKYKVCMSNCELVKKIVNACYINLPAIQADENYDDLSAEEKTNVATMITNVIAVKAIIDPE